MSIHSSTLDSSATIPDFEDSPEPAGEPTLIFRVGDSLYGCGVVDAQEIIPMRAMTRLPGAPVYVRGLINVRGIIVTVIDLGRRLEPDARRNGEATEAILLVRHGARLAGLVVHEVRDVAPIELEASGADGSQAMETNAIVRGIGSVGGAAVVVLDLDALIRQVLIS